MPAVQLNDALQRREAPRLRADVIHHLKVGKGPVAEGFRGEYFPCYSTNYNEFLDKQRQNGIWGTYVEAAALGELLGVNVVVTPVNSGKEQSKICLYKAADPKAKTVHLYNSNNTHWYFLRGRPSATVGDGNCLYNSFAQALHSHENTFESAVVASPKTISTSQFGLFNHAVAEHQQAILNAIQNHPTPAEVEANLINDRDRISRLSHEEQQQIANDYAYALKVARNEVPDVNTYRLS